MQLQSYSDLDAAYLAAIVASSNDAIVTKTLDGVVTTWNAAATRIFGYEPQEMIGENITKIIPLELRSEEDDILARLRRGERVEHFDTIRQTKEKNRIHVSLTISPVIDAGGRIIGASKIARDVTERKRSEERQRMLMNELKHRLKNTLSTVRAIAVQTYKGEQDSAGHANFSRRIAALAASYDILIQDDLRGARLHDLVNNVLDPFRPSEDAIRINGRGEFELSPRHASSLALALNELATNATKYGALSQPGGHVALGWEQAPGPENSVSFEWIERGGPEVVPPRQRGFGTQVLEFALKHELNAKTELRYAPEGFEFRMQF